MKRKYKMMSAFLVVIVICIGIIVVTQQRHKIYEYDYFSKLGILSYDRGYTYDKMIKNFGKPLKIQKIDKDTTHIMYNNLFFGFYKDVSVAEYVVITSQKYRFGVDHIGVGSTKAAVEKAYLRAFKKEVTTHTISYRDGPTFKYPWIVYYFDDNDKVVKIEINLETV